MAVGETLATGVQAAIGSKFPLSGTRLLYASFYGSLGAIDLNTRVLSFLGGGYSNPEDVAIASGSNNVYMTERAGNLLRIDMAKPDRAQATLLASGLTAPQQIALSADEHYAFVIEYNPAAPSRLLRFDLTAAPPTMTIVLNDIQAGVGVIYDDATSALFFTEQAGTGTLTRIDTGVAGAPRTLIADQLPAPFFLSWWDATHTKLLVPQRDPYNRIVSVDLTANPAPVRRVLDGVPFRPSSVTVMPSGHLIVCSDREITDYDMSAGPAVAESRGLGAGGSLYCPVVCPTDINSQELLISCDMGGLYRSTNQGRTWVLQDGRSVKAGTAVSAAYDPLTPATMVSTHVVAGLVTGTAVGNLVTWAPLTPPLAGIGGDQVQGLAFTPDGKSLIVATSGALHRLDRSTSPATWSSATTASLPALGSVPVPIGDLISVASPGPGGPAGRCFAADIDRVYWSEDHGATWWAVVPTAGQALPTPKRIAGLAAGVSGANTVVYATASTIDDAFTGAGVYRLQLAAAAIPSAPPAWSNVSANLTQAPVINPMPPPAVFWPQYDVLASPQSAADTVYVGMPTGMAFGPPSWTIWKGQWNPATGQMAWGGAFDGFTVQAAHNVGPAWIDLNEVNPADPKPQPALGFGFGGPPHGIGCAAATGDVTLQTNEAFADLTTAGAPNTPAGWQQCYSLSVPTFNGQRWRTTGLDVTNVWSYRVHPDPAKGSIHFLANTDIALSRSDDAGDTWQLIYPHRVGTFWGNFYELEFNSSTGEIWAAVSVEHDLPYSDQLDWEAYIPPPGQPPHLPGSGAVLRSVDDGLTWSELGAATLPDNPVLSVVYGGKPAALYAAVWRKGVYQLQAGNIWQPVGNIGGGLRARRLAFDKTGNLIALTSGIDQGAGLYKWTGATWTSLTITLVSTFYNPLGKFYPFDFCVDPVMPNSYWVCTVGVQGGYDGAVYRSDDGGISWIRVFNLGSTGTIGPKYQIFMHCTAVTFDPNDSQGRTVYVTTETHGIWYSTDRGVSWQEFTPIPFMATQRITFDPHDVGTIYIATKGGGAWRTMSAAKAASIHQAMRRQAYALYQGRGGASGHAFDDWVAAYHAAMDATVRTRAYELAKLRDFSGQHALDDWLQAEQEALRALLI
jgi:hypothetical protein